MSAVLTLLGYRVLGGRPVRGATPRRRAPAPGRAPARPRRARRPTQPMPVVVAVAADEAPTTVAPPSGYRPLWARNTSPPSS